MLTVICGPGRSLHRALLLSLLLVAASGGGCGGAGSTGVSDPLSTLGSTDSTQRQLVTAMDILDADPTRPEYVQSLRRMLHVDGYTIPSRMLALDRLERIDPDALKRTLEVQLPRLNALEWRRRLCEVIAERGWTDYGPTLVRAWADPRPGWVDRDEDRPERIALEKLYGRDRIDEYLFQTLLESDAVSSQNLRTRCWEMLIRLGARDKLARMLADASVNPDDAFILDLRAASVELGVFPVNREEILWLRKLREPSRVEFFNDARAAVAKLPEATRRNLEIRDLPIVVAASRHRPEILAQRQEQLHAALEASLKSPQAGKEHTIDFEGWSGDFKQRLQQWRPELTWGDVAAMTLALEAIRVPELAGHLFDYGDRDVRDLSTEYGGVLRLDGSGRFELVEVPPKIRGNDERFNAPQELLDAGYTSLFHFHFHATRYDNARYAAPAQGDMLYADGTRANALVFTFIDRDTLNVDFYRHSQVSVDLGEIRRPAR